MFQLRLVLLQRNFKSFLEKIPIFLVCKLQSWARVPEMLLRLCVAFRVFAQVSQTMFAHPCFRVCIFTTRYFCTRDIRDPSIRRSLSGPLTGG